MRVLLSSQMKSVNRRMVYNIIRLEGEANRTELAKRTAISSPTILKITNFFIERGILLESGTQEMGLGRKPVLLRFNPLAAYSVGVEMERGEFHIGIVDLGGDVAFQKTYPASQQFATAISQELYSAILACIQESGVPFGKILGIGIGIPGIVDSRNNVVNYAPLIGVTEPFDCSDIFRSISENTGLKIYIENDVNAAALGEQLIRKLPLHDDLLYISLGTGLGSGIILNGELRKGTNNAAGEMGYMVFDSAFHTQLDQVGWLESKINLDGLQTQWGDLQQGLPPEQFAQVVDLTASLISLCIANYSALFDTAAVIIGGVTVDKLGMPLLEAVRKYSNRLCLYAPDIQLFSNRYNGVIGAAALAADYCMDELFVS